MSVRKDLTPNQGKRYELKQILFQANPERFQAFLAGEIDAGTAPGLAVIFGREQGLEMKIVASICQEAKGDKYFTTTYMVKDDGPVKRVQDLKGGTIGVVGIKTATDLWARAGLLNAGLVPDKDTKVVPMAFPRSARRCAAAKSPPAPSSSRSTQPRWRKAACASFHRHRRDGLRPRAPRHLLRREIPGSSPRRGARLPRRLRRRHQVLPREHRAGQDRLAQGGLRAHPAPVYLKTADWKRDPNARVDVESLKKLSASCATSCSGSRSR